MTPVVLDACVLVPYHLSNLLLCLADDELFRPLWSAELLNEVRRHVSAAAATRVDRMARAFPLAAVEDYRALMPAMTNHPKDRHVLAAAVHAKAELIVTANVRDFAAEHTSRHDVTAVHPDDFLMDLLEEEPSRVLRVVQQQVASYARPELSLERLLDSLRLTVPTFAAALPDLATAATG